MSDAAAPEPTAPRPDPPPSRRDRELSGYIFMVSAGLVGVCLTVTGLFNLLRRADQARTVADNLVAMDSLVLLFSCCFAYLALRAARERSWRLLERIADALFLLGIFGMVLICALIAYELV